MWACIVPFAPSGFDKIGINLRSLVTSGLTYNSCFVPSVVKTDSQCAFAVVGVIVEVAACWRTATSVAVNCRWAELIVPLRASTKPVCV